MNVRRFLGGLAIATIAAGTLAAIPVGSQAPNFSLQATKAGKVFTFDLAAALKKGPVVLYFYPAAFTPGCTIEAHSFAEAIPQYQALGATVIGVSRDPLDKLQQFSVSECRNKFAVAADTAGTVTKAFDVPLPQDPSVADRTSFVIAPDGKIVYEFTNLTDPEAHVTNTLDALKKWEAANPAPGASPKN
jgi:peroxiredoxin